MTNRDIAIKAINSILNKVGDIDLDDLNPKLQKAIIASGIACIESKQKKKYTQLKYARAVLYTRLRLGIAATMYYVKDDEPRCPDTGVSFLICACNNCLEDRMGAPGAPTLL